MRRRDFRQIEKPLVMIIPMIDIMLFLLVFFMLGTFQMVRTNNFAVNLPQSETRQKETSPPKVTVTVTASGDLLFEEEKILFLQLPAKIKQTLNEDAATVFVIYGDRATKYESVVKVLELLKKSGACQVSIATEIKK